MAVRLRILPRSIRIPGLSRVAPLFRPYSTDFESHPSPPRLPEAQQAEFERLQRSANTQQPETAADKDSPFPATSTANPQEGREGTLGEISNLPLRKGAPPEFEGEVNPKTGEVGGPKNEPLRWGAKGDWSYNGRVTDF